MFAACITMGEFSYLTQNWDKDNEKDIEGLKVMAQYFERQEKKEKIIVFNTILYPRGKLFYLMVIT